MKKLLLVFLSFVVSYGVLQAQDHLLITEFVVTPTEGEFIEIYNPTDNVVDLSNYYITDATFASGATFYYKIVTGNAGGGSFGDFSARFPAGASIAPHEYQTVSLAGSTKFNTTYGVLPTYELFEDDAAADAIPDLLEATTGSINKQGGLTNNGEILILFYWDGLSDLVQDVDYVVWGDKEEAVDKSGVSIDGPDADTNPSTYLNDTPISSQFVVNVENDADADPHDGGKSAQRKLSVEDLEAWEAGNGVTGHNETSEDVSWKGGIWCLNAAPTPGKRALADDLNIADVQFIRASDIGPTANDDSPFTGDTLTVTGIAMHGPRDIYLGARWGAFVQDESGGPWSGFFIVQNDSTITGTDLNAVQPGDKIRMTGVLQEFPTNPNTQSISQFALFTSPAVPVEFIEFGLPVPEPIVLTPGDLGATGSSEDPRLTERWESCLVTFKNLTVLSNYANQPGNILIATDPTGTIAIDDYFLSLRTYLDSHQGVWPNLPPGTKIDVTGFVRDVQTGGVGRTTINPRNLDDIKIAAAPPVITDIRRTPVAVKPTDNVKISAKIFDIQGTVAKADLHYRADKGAFQAVTMSPVDSIWSGTIPPQVDGAFIEYFLTAEDAGGDATIIPGDTATTKFFFFVRARGLSIFDLQYTPYANGNSSYLNLEVTVQGIVTSGSSDFAYYYIQDSIDPWSGIWVNDLINNVELGDEVVVTGTVQEDFNVTRIGILSDVSVISQNNKVFDPILVKTGDLRAGTKAESYEGMLVRVENVVVTDPFPDTPGNYGEFSIDDGSGAVRVDDLGNFRGNLDSSFVKGDSLRSVTGIHYYSFGNYKLAPRNAAEVVRAVTSVSDDKLPYVYDLAQNYPNPFNPETTIRFELANRGRVTVKIFNLMGQTVKTLVDEVRPAGVHTIRWDGTNDLGTGVSNGVYFYRMKSGDFNKARKMILMK